MTKTVLGVIADDFTGATDIANTLVKGGLSTLQTLGVPPPSLALPDCVAIVVALKTRSILALEAVHQSLDALNWLKQRGARKFVFKYCSTFDSTARGNIGPVGEALAGALGQRVTVYCPAFPENGRTIYNGHLFVGEKLLSRSGMEKHPLNPMTNPDLVDVLQAQSRGKVGLVPYSAVSRGADALRNRLDELASRGATAAIVDALVDADLVTLANATRADALVTGGSGIAIGLPDLLARHGLVELSPSAAVLPRVPGLEAVVSGSCSNATNAQLRHAMSRAAMYEIDPQLAADGRDVVAEALAFARERLREGRVIIASSVLPDALERVQASLGKERSAALTESLLAAIAKGLVDMGVSRLIVAGGETSGAVVQALGVKALRIGAQIDPGVPWTLAIGTAKPLALALKSGNFGGVDFFTRAFDALPK